MPPLLAPHHSLPASVLPVLSLCSTSTSLFSAPQSLVFDFRLKLVTLSKQNAYLHRALGKFAKLDIRSNNLNSSRRHRFYRLVHYRQACH
ncbi:hypothetical protein QL285_013606 [Trifolium repens]|nr:hypothetical protein QL285_013606 [Trifolium repens]